MKKVFVSILLAGFVFNYVNAEDVKQTKETKEIKQKELDKLNEEIIAILKNN